MAAELLAYIDSTAAQHNLDGSSVSNPRHVAGRQGFYMPPFAQLGQRTPQQPGETIRYTDILPRVFTVPLLVKDPAGSEATLRTQIRTMLNTWFNMPGVFRSTDPSGGQRDLNSYYLSGLELDENLDSGVRGGGWAYVVPQFEAADPFWYDTTATTTMFTNTQLASPISVTNNGDVECWPVWAITGPFVNLQIANTTTGKTIKLTANGGISFTVGHTLTIDLTPGKKTFLKEDLTNQVGFLTTDSVLGSLVPGANSLTFTMTGNTSATTATVTYKQRYYAP